MIACLSPATQYSMYAPTSYVESTGLSSLVGSVSTVSRILVTVDVLKHPGSGYVSNLVLSSILGLSHQYVSLAISHVQQRNVHTWFGYI